MTSERNARASQLADNIRRFLSRQVARPNSAGELERSGLSQRQLATLLGIPRSTLGDLLRNPAQASARTLERFTSALTSPLAQFADRRISVTYVDAPLFTRESLEGMRPPNGARAFRVVTETDEARYRSGFRSSEWIGDLNALADVGDSVPGGPSAITRIVWDTGV